MRRPRKMNQSKPQLLLKTEKVTLQLSVCHAAWYCTAFVCLLDINVPVSQCLCLDYDWSTQLDIQLCSVSLSWWTECVTCCSCICPWILSLFITTLISSYLSTFHILLPLLWSHHTIFLISSLHTSSFHYHSIHLLSIYFLYESHGIPFTHFLIPDQPNPMQYNASVIH